MRQWTAINMAKLARKASRATGRKGTDLPGQVARKIDQNILRKLAGRVDEVVFVSGTNGKTTTSNLIGHTLKANHIEIIHNNEACEHGCWDHFSFHRPIDTSNENRHH